MGGEKHRCYAASVPPRFSSAVYLCVRGGFILRGGRSEHVSWSSYRRVVRHVNNMKLALAKVAVAPRHTPPGTNSVIRV